MNDALVQLVWRRARGRCEYCGMPHEFDYSPFEIDHVVARQHRGPTRPGNLALACFEDNRCKGPNLSGVDPQTRKKTWLFDPRRHKWSKHFRYDGPVLVGLTPAGRTTIALLDINAEHRVEQRLQLITEGVFLV